MTTLINDLMNTLLKLMFFVLVVLGTGCADDGIRKSPNDDREYRHLVLENGLRLVLISDLDADKSAASLVVFRGSFDDPDERPGLAHFLEHMLFIGTEKYPEAGDYFKFIQGHGGNANAYTTAEHTNYFFDIQPEYFHEGLDRFAQFFISPLLDPAYAEREKNAVHSEYQLQLKEDGWRGYAVLKAVVNPDHPFARFTIGSLETLSGDVQEALSTFFEAQYSANQMGLVVLSNEPLDELQPWVVETFSPIKNRNLPSLSRTTPLFTQGQLPTRLNIQSLRPHKDLAYSFMLPVAIKDTYPTKPLAYITSLIGHEGEGSLHKALKEQGWITSLGASVADYDDNNNALGIFMRLTDEGANQLPRITAHLFEYLTLLRNEGLAKWRYGEIAQLSELAFRYQEKSSELARVASIAPLLTFVPPRDLVVAPYLMDEFDPDLIQSFLDLLQEDNVLMVVSGPDLEGDLTEPWFQVPYALIPGPLETSGPVDASALHLPLVNPFIPGPMTLVSGDDRLPQPRITTDGLDIYLATDTEFRVPRATTYISIRNEGGLIDIKDRVRASLYARLVRDDLNALAYPAQLAGVGYGVAAPPKGFRLFISGYQDKQLLLLDEVLTRLVGLKIAPERFAILKADMTKSLMNTTRDKPYQQLSRRLGEEMLNSSWTPEESLAQLESVTPADLRQWRDETLASPSVYVLSVGNVLASHAEALEELLAKHLEFSDVPPAEAEVLTLNSPGNIEVHIDHDDAAMVLYVQDDEEGYKDWAHSALLGHLLRPRYFASLRTEQQLGYAVSAGSRNFDGWGGIRFAIQSPVASADELRSRTLAFMDAQVDELTAMPEEEFATNKDGLITTLLQKDKNLAQRAQRYWHEMDQDNLNFDTNVQLAAEVELLSKADILSYLNAVRDKLQNQYLMIFNTGKFAESEIITPQ